MGLNALIRLDALLAALLGSPMKALNFPLILRIQGLLGIGVFDFPHESILKALDDVGLLIL